MHIDYCTVLTLYKFDLLAANGNAVFGNDRVLSEFVGSGPPHHKMDFENTILLFLSQSTFNRKYNECHANYPMLKGGDLGGTAGDGPLNLRRGTAHAYVPPIFRINVHSVFLCYCISAGKQSTVFE